MARPQQRYRGVRQRHWGSWVSEIRHPVLKTRIWLGTFETAEVAARAYDEASRLICGPKSRTNFPYDSSLSSANIFSPSLAAKLHKCHIEASLRVKSNKPSPSTPRKRNTKLSDSTVAQETGRIGEQVGHIKGTQGLKVLEDDHIEQMIEELVDYESIELCFVCPKQAK